MKIHKKIHKHAVAIAISLTALAFGCRQATFDTGGNRHDAGDAQPDEPQMDIPVSEVPPDVKDEECGEFRAAQLVPLDLYIMLDASGSMDYLLEGSTTTKWKAVTKALKDFASKAEMEGLNIALQIFPYMRDVPRYCAKHAECGEYGPCNPLRMCDEFWFEDGKEVPCNSNADCNIDGKSATCSVRGECVGYPGTVCLVISGICSELAVNCVNTQGSCEKRQSCDVADYSEPTVPLGPLSEVLSDFKKALDDKEPEGVTPTAEALKGAVQYFEARLAQQEHKYNRAAVVLVTDGLPTACDGKEIGIEGIIETASSAAPQILTYVMGVFEEENAVKAKTNLDAIAMAGHTESAFIVTTSQDVTKEFLATLESIREHFISCEYTIPDNYKNFGHVNVMRKHGDDELDIVKYKPDCESEDGDGIGWHYDIDPNVGIPTMIQLCSSTCAEIQGDDAWKLDIQLGCVTIK